MSREPPQGFGVSPSASAPKRRSAARPLGKATTRPAAPEPRSTPDSAPRPPPSKGPPRACAVIWRSVRSLVSASCMAASSRRWLSFSVSPVTSAPVLLLAWHATKLPPPPLERQLPATVLAQVLPNSRPSTRADPPAACSAADAPASGRPECDGVAPAPPQLLAPPLPSWPLPGREREPPPRGPLPVRPKLLSGRSCCAKMDSSDRHWTAWGSNSKRGGAGAALGRPPGAATPGAPPQKHRRASASGRRPPGRRPPGQRPPGPKPPPPHRRPQISDRPSPRNRPPDRRRQGSA